MENFFSFVAAYVSPILAVIFGITTIYFSNKKTTNEETANKETTNKSSIFVKLVATLLSIFVIIICYVNYTPKPGKPGKGEGATVSTTLGLEEDLSVNSDLAKPLPENAYAVIEASSTYDGDLVTHTAYNLIDDDLKTNWTEGVYGNGEGEYVDFTFHTEQPVAGFIIWAGNHSNDTYFEKNAKPRNIVLTFSDGSTKKYTLSGKKKEQEIYFDKIVNTNSIRLTIDSVYPGSTWEDTVISEIDILVQESQ